MDDKRHKLLIKATFSSVVNLAIFGVLLFLPAGTLAWWRAWVFLGVVVLGSIATMFHVFPGNEGLLEERLKPPIQQGQPRADKVIVLLFIGSFFGWIIFIPMDLFHWHLLGQSGPVISVIGLLLLMVGWWIVSLALKENAYAAPVVKHQAERNQKVITTGVYAIVRHPMYAGLVVFLAGMALWLQSNAALLAACVPVGTLAVRILVEEQFLRRELPGYGEYMNKVRTRLIPGLW